jgi:hypothetical protein
MPSTRAELTNRAIVALDRIAEEPIVRELERSSDSVDRLALRIHVDSTQMTRVASALVRVDREFRRATRMVEQPDRSTPIRPRDGGLRIVKTRDGSLEALAEFYGATEALATSHPITLATVFGALAFARHVVVRRIRARPDVDAFPEIHEPSSHRDLDIDFPPWVNANDYADDFGNKDEDDFDRQYGSLMPAPAPVAAVLKAGEVHLDVVPR